MYAFQHGIIASANGGGGGTNPLWNGLQAYYTADNTPNDALGNYNGTLVNGATYGTGIINQGFSLDGVNDYVAISDMFISSTGYSVSMWVNLNSTTGCLIQKYNSYALGLEFNFGFVSNKLYCWQYDNVNSGLRGRIVNTTSTYVTLSNWHLLTYTYDGGALTTSTKIYIDGIQRDDTNFSSGTFVQMRDTNSIVNIGQPSLGISGYANGLIDEVAVFNKELSASEVTELYNAGAGKQYPN